MVGQMLCEQMLARHIKDSVSHLFMGQLCKDFYKCKLRLGIVLHNLPWYFMIVFLEMQIKGKSMDKLMTILIKTLFIMTLLMTLPMTLLIMNLLIMTLIIMTLIIMTLHIITLLIMTLLITVINAA
jgi:hypothetical protein